jgi:Protein of unknown function (DUF998)
MNSVSLIFGSVTIISALIFLVLTIVLHFLPNKFNPIKNTVSDYAAALSNKYYLVKIATPLSAAISTFSLAFTIAVSNRTISTYVILFLVVSSICRLMLIFFPTDITGQTATKIGNLHLTFAMLSFAGIAFAAANFSVTNIDKIVGQVVVYTAILLLIGFLPMFKKVFGLLERIFLASSIVWLIVVGFELLHP